MPMKEIAWNGIRFQAPADWEVGRIGSYYLMLEKESGPVLEMKWGRVKGVFSHKKHMRRLSVLHGKRSGISIGESPLTPEWEDALDGFSATGFSWQGTSMGGMGAILYCPMCHNATLIQFHHNDSGESKNTTLSVLNSFSDHRADGQIRWAVFDIQAMIPEKFKLVRQRLVPGKTELAFEAKGRKVTLHRWGPAAVLLRGRGIAGFAETMAGMPSQHPDVMINIDEKSAEWAVSPSVSILGRAFGGIRRKHPFKRFRLWHLKKKNRILGVGAEGKKPFDPHFLDRICADYDSL
ncbi:MAG: hypothetical protein ABII68_02925 [Pseudomonadota bacterium]